MLCFRFCVSLRLLFFIELLGLYWRCGVVVIVSSCGVLVTQFKVDGANLRMYKTIKTKSTPTKRLL